MYNCHYVNLAHEVFSIKSNMFQLFKGVEVGKATGTNSLPYVKPAQTTCNGSLVGELTVGSNKTRSLGVILLELTY